MKRVRRYQSEFDAQRAAAHLRASGVAAAVVGQHTATMLGVANTLHAFFGNDVVILIPSQLDQAAALLEELDATPAEPEEGWEDSAARPDLALLDESEYEIDCPSCREPAALDVSVERCAACGSAFDAVDRLVELHGPEALEGCYESEELRFDPAELAVPCGECGYDLSGMPARDRCPECGALYDKAELYRRLVR